MPIDSYKGVQILIEFREAKSGGWAADYTLERDDGSVEHHHGTAAFQSSDLAYRQALADAKRIIDEEDSAPSL